VNWVLIPAAASVSRVFEGDVPPPNGCGSNMTRTSRPRLAASSRARITLRWYRQLPEMPGNPRQMPFVPPSCSPACPSSSRIEASYRKKSYPRGHSNWNLAPVGQHKPYHVTCLLIRRPAWPAISGVSLRQASPIRPVAGQGVRWVTRSSWAWDGVANAFPGRSCDAH